MDVAITLQNAFYVVSLVFMGVLLVLLVALLAVALVIKSKINKLHRAIDQRVGQVKDFGFKTAAIMKALKLVIRH